MQPLHMATFNGHLAVGKFLIERRSNVNAAVVGKETVRPLDLAVQSCHDDLANFLVRQGADTTAQDLLHPAAGRSCLPLVRSMVKAGAKVRARSQKEDTLLHATA